MKKKLILLSAVVICIAIAAAGTLAYFTADTTAHNVITSGGVDIEIYEWANEAKTEEFKNPISGVMPSQSVTKIVEIVNEPDKDNPSAQAWIRAKIDVKVELKDGTIVTNNDAPIILESPKDSKWAMGGDGYYYYTEKVDPGAVTEPLITGVKFDAKMGNEYQNCKVTVFITAHAVQTAHNGETVYKAQGWPSLPLEGEGGPLAVDEVEKTDATSSVTDVTASPQGEAGATTEPSLEGEGGPLAVDEVTDDPSVSSARQLCFAKAKHSVFAGANTTPTYAGEPALAAEGESLPCAKGGGHAVAGGIVPSHTSL